MPSTLIVGRTSLDAFEMIRKDSGSYALRVNMQWNTRPLGWLPEARSKPKHRGFRRGHYPTPKKKVKVRMTEDRTRKAHAYMVEPATHADHTNRQDLRQHENYRTCYINFPRLSLSRNDATTNGESPKAPPPSNDTEPDKITSSSNKVSGTSQTTDNSKGADIVVKKVSAYPSDFFKLNRHITDATDELGGIKLSDILSNRGLHQGSNSKSDASASEEVRSALSNDKTLPELTSVKTTEFGDMMLKGFQAPVKIKHEERNSDDDVADSGNLILNAGSGVTLEEAPAISSHDVREVWCEDTEDGRTVSPCVLEDKYPGSPESPILRGDSPAEMERSPNDYVITGQIMQKLQPAVPHVIWPDNKFMTHNTAFVYGSPSRLAPVIVPVHSVDCPISKMFFPSTKGNVCPPNSPTSFLTKEYGFYPVERHYGNPGS